MKSRLVIVVTLLGVFLSGCSNKYKTNNSDVINVSSKYIDINIVFQSDEKMLPEDIQLKGIDWSFTDLMEFDNGIYAANFGIYFTEEKNTIVINELKLNIPKLSYTDEIVVEKQIKYNGDWYNKDNFYIYEDIVTSIGLSVHKNKIIARRGFLLDSTILNITNDKNQDGYLINNALQMSIENVIIEEIDETFNLIIFHLSPQVNNELIEPLQLKIDYKDENNDNSFIYHQGTFYYFISLNNID